MVVLVTMGDVTERERRVLASNTWIVSAIVLWELAKLARLGQIDIDLDDAELTRTLSSIHVWPIDLAVSIQSTRLDFKSDPAAELIAATSIVHQVPLLTRDRRHLAYQFYAVCRKGACERRQR